MATAFLLVFLATSAKAQEGGNTVDVMIQSEASYDGFTLLPVTSSNSTFLINNCGEEVKCWTSNYKAGMMAYLLPDGDMIRAGRMNNPGFSAGDTGGIIERYNWGACLSLSDKKKPEQRLGFFCLVAM